jgi:replicative DNA helicase
MSYENAEAALLGSFLLEPTIIKNFKKIKAEDFAVEAHSHIFTAMMEMDSNDEAIDLTLLATKLQEKKLLEDVGGPEYLAELMNETPLATHAFQYSQAVKHRSLLRELKVVGQKMGEVEGSAPEILEQLRDLMGGIKEKISYWDPEKQVVDVDPIDQENTILTWGTDELDKTISPIEPHYFIVLTGESGSGKTAYTFDLAIKNSRIGKVLFISLEMGSSEIITRIAMNHAGISKEQWRDKRKISEAQRNVYKTKRAELTSLGQLHTVGLNDASIEGICQTILKHKPVLAIVDNMDLIDKDKQGREQLEHEAMVSKKFMNFTNRYKIPVMLVHHLKKGKEGKERMRGLNAVKGSSKIVHDADSVIMCHRTLSKTESLSAEEKCKFTVIELKARTFGVGGVKTVYFNRGTFDDEYLGPKQPSF